jgi:hypothetical protein
LLKELDENEEIEEQAIYDYQQKNNPSDYIEDEEIEEEDVIDVWSVRNNAESNLCQLEILTYENKLNCTNRKLVNVCKGKVEAMCIYNTNQIWCIDSTYNIYIFSCKTYSKINQYYIDLPSMGSNIISMHPFETTNQILICSSNGILLFLDLNNKQNTNSSINKNKNDNNNTNEIEYLLYDLSVKIYSTIILPTRYDKK